MAADEVKRKLSAIFSADVEGYSRLMGEDELGTIETLTLHKETMRKLIRQYRGRVVDSTGDNLLAEFTSVVDAVQCAVEVQQVIGSKNEDLPENRRMRFRIGINLGDVIEEEDRIYGDGVNIAARVESLAEAGGICISGSAFEQIENKLALGYQYVGEHSVKNIVKPIKVYKVPMEPEAVVATKEEKIPSLPFWRRKVVLAGAAAVLVVIIGAAVWNFYWRVPTIELATKEKIAFPLPDKPSIAVLPFDNLSKDLEQEYFVDGMTDDLITDLSKISEFFIIARNSSFQYKGKERDVKKISRELGVRYIIEGSVRKAGEKIRINAQLIDATTGGHVWAERFDGKIDDIFALQDNITRKIVSAISLKLKAKVEVKVPQKETENISAYDEFLKGMKNYYLYTPEGFNKAVSHFKKSLTFDPNYGKANAALALTYWNATKLGAEGLMSIGEPWAQARLTAIQYLKKAMKNPNAIAHQINSEILLMRRQYDESLTEARRAISIDSSDPNGQLIMALGLIMAGRHADSISFTKKAIQLDPLNPARPLALLGLTSFCDGEVEKALEFMQRANRHNPKMHREKTLLAACYAILGKADKAKAAIQSFTNYSPATLMNLKHVMYFWPFKDIKVSNRLADGLIKAGLPGERGAYYKISKENRLAGDKVQDLLFGKKVEGRILFTGYLWAVERDRDGMATLESYYGSETGRTWIDGDMICNDFHFFWVRGEHCAFIVTLMTI